VGPSTWGVGQKYNDQVNIWQVYRTEYSCQPNNFGDGLLITGVGSCT
jgi:hypothetical protein